MESPVDVKGRKWQAADDSVIKKVRKMKKKKISLSLVIFMVILP